VQCERCQHDNPAHAKFCSECGTPLAASCRQCDTTLPPHAKFCLECGARVDDTAPATADPGAGERARPHRESERKQVTVLFADVVNFTGMAERLDPERVHAIMDRCVRLLVEEVQRYEGTVNQFTGDGIMALFGAPIAHEHAPERAVRAALGMQAAVGQYGEDLQRTDGIEFRMRIGVHTGPVVVGNVGDDTTGDYTALGDTTNLASRLQTAATPGAVVVSEATARLITDRFTMRALGPLALKGKSKRIEAFEIERALPRAPLLPVSERGLTPLIGRAAELATLEAVVDHVRGGNGQLALVVGDAGLGKSRLVHEFRKRLGDEFTWLVGRCVSFGKSIPFLPILDTFKAGFGIEESDDEPTIIEKIQRGIAALGPDVADTEPYLRALLAVDPGDATLAAKDASARRFATFDALKRLMLATAPRRPMVVLVEDLHWIDQGSEEFLNFIVDALATAPILVLCTFRPPYRPPFRERGYITRLALQPLSRDQTAEMATAILDADTFPMEVRGLIAEKAEGNPFFIEEVTKSLLEIGALVRENGGYALGRPVSEIIIPDTIQDVIMARIDRLGEAPKRAIQVASVIGREFAVRLLQRAADLGDRVETLVGELGALELIYEKSGVPELAYMFKHAMTHDVAYESLLVERRKELHTSIGRATEELYTDRIAEHLETLAHHFYRGEDWPRAFNYLVGAGNKARDSFANREAVHYYTRALEIADRVAASDAERAEIHQGKGSAHFGMSEFPEAVDSLRAALALTTNEIERDHVTIAIAWALLWTHDMDGAVAMAQDLLPSAQARDDAALEANATYLVAFAGMSRGQIDECAPTYDRALELATRADAPARAASIRGFVGLVANWRGDYAKAIPDVESAVATLKAENQLYDLSMMYSTVTMTLGGAGEYARALAQASEGIALGNATGERVWTARTWNSRGWILGELGALDAAEEANRRCLELAGETGSVKMTPELLGNAEANLADIALWRGDLNDAAAHLDTVAAIIGTPGNEWMVWRYRMHYQLTSAALALAKNDLGAARDQIAACLVCARTTRSRRYIVRATRLLAECQLAAGKLQEAEMLLASTVADARSLGNPPQIWQALAAYARVLDTLGKRDEAAAAWREVADVVARTTDALPDEVRGAFADSPIRRALGEAGA